MRTEPSTSRSSVTGASAYFATNDINTNLETKVTELQRQLEHLKCQNQTTQQTRPGSRPPTTTSSGATPIDQWRTWTFWCHTQGANLSHHSTTCSHPKDGHKKEATQSNPMGGNSTRDHLIEILSPNKTQFNARTARTSPSTFKHQRSIPKITFTSSTCPCPFKPNTICMSIQTE
jgi:hypothetical protein